MDHAVDIAVEADEETEFGLVLDLAFDLAADRIFLGEDFQGLASVCLRPSEMRRLTGSTFEHLNIDFLARRDDLAGMHVLLGPGHF